MGVRKDLAIAGCGAIAKEHLRVLKQIDAINLVAVCDIDKDVATRTAREWDVDHCYTNFSEMLDKEEPSIVSILTPPQAHAAMAVEAICRGINILVEKPLTTTTSEAELILKALRGTYVKLTLNYNALLNETMMKALRLVENSAAGQVLGVEVRMLHTKDDQMASDEKHWCHKMPGGRFGEMLAHPIYLLQSMLGNNLEVEKILTDKRGNHSWMRHDELYVLLHSNNGIGQIHVSFNSPRPAFLVDVYGTEKILKIDLMNQTLLALGHRTLSKKDSAMDTLGVSRELFSQTMRNSWRYLLRQRGHDALERAYASLVGSIEEDRPLLVTPEMAYHTVRIEEGICKQIG